MDLIFEAKYISIKWYDKNTVLKIDEAILPISVQIESDSTYGIELQSYTRIKNGLDGQIAFHILDSSSSVIPYFVNASKNKISLLKITDPLNNKIWWIENGKWSKEHKYRSSPLWNHVGETKIIFDNITCNINVRANSFTREELNLYLNDFRNDFWYLIIQKDSITHGDAKNTKVKLLNNDTAEIISKFINYTEKVLENPKKELREVQRLKNIKKVKPVARTFMEIATSGFKRKLTSRDTIESYNVLENRFIHYILQRVCSIVLYMLRASGHMEEIYENKYNYDKKRLQNFSDKKTIDQEAYENEIIDLKQRLQEEKIKLKNSILSQEDSLKIELEKKINNQTSLAEKIQYALNSQETISTQENPSKFIIKIQNKKQNCGNKLQFWGNIKSIEAEDWDDFGINNWFSLEFNHDIFSFFESGEEYAITANNSYSKVETQRGIIHKINFFNISELIPLNMKEANKYSSKLEYKVITIKTYKSKIFNNRIQFSGEAQLTSGDWYKFKNNDFYSFEFDAGIFNDVLNNFQEYKIKGYVESTKQPWNNGEKHGNIHKRYFQYITEIEQLSQSPIQMALEKLESERTNLEATNWERPLNVQEKQEQEYEKKALEKSISLLKEQQKDNLKLLEGIKPKLDKLKQLLNKCKVLKIEKENCFPSSMTFIQNPNYQGSYNFYKKVNELVGVDEDLFIDIQLVEKIGLLDMPTIYERWCFLQIVKVIVDKYRFIPEEKWKRKLANQVMCDLNNVRNVKIKFTNDTIEREINLWYEKVLPNKKRPDFILDIKSTFNIGYTHQLIMDAKFHEDVNIREQINLLYHIKNYSENNKNTVFILHPDANRSVKNKRTPKEWGDDAYYGEIDMFNYDWDKGNPNHKYGAILLSPVINRGGYLDNLQRLIGMSMQYNLVDNSHILLGDLEKKKEMLDPRPEEKVFCLVCGSDKFHVSKTTTRKGYGYRYNFTCDECKHFYMYNYCWQCNHRLIKNGEYWSYHSVQIMEHFNIRCPNCSELLLGNNTKNMGTSPNIPHIEADLKVDNKSNAIRKSFDSYKEALLYAKNNPSRTLTKNSNGDGWIIK